MLLSFKPQGRRSLFVFVGLLQLAMHYSGCICIVQEHRGTESQGVGVRPVKLHRYPDSLFPGRWTAHILYGSDLHGFLCVNPADRSSPHSSTELYSQRSRSLPQRKIFGLLSNRGGLRTGSRRPRPPRRLWISAKGNKDNNNAQSDRQTGSGQGPMETSTRRPPRSSACSALGAGHGGQSGPRIVRNREGLVCCKRV
ncbi:hypothetical protein VTN02DRAFT_4397 [Thermoascus thermophilus]